MISSEVQRTLVKSPPELWSELSDPASLARHLGALGEIRITRVEAEKRVDWEADKTTGSVHIKPSGWGTKVTLSVTRDVILTETPTSDPEAHDEEPAASTADPHPQGELASPAGGPHAPDERPAARDVDPPAPAADAPVTQALDSPAPAEAPDESAEPVAAVQPTVPEAFTPEEKSLPIEAEPVAPQAPRAPLEPEPETEPRRGFLARLFGRRRRPVAEPEISAGHEQTEAVSHACAATQIATEPSPPGHEARRSSAIESLQARFQPEPVAEAGTETTEEVVEPEVVEPALVEPALVEPAVVELQVAAPTDVVAETAELVTSDEPLDAGEAAPPEPSQPTAGLSAELEAAEEVAAEEVTAVLTAVLDRLGAAHHRPFSRA